MTTTFITIKEVNTILNRLPRVARQKIKYSVTTPSLYKRVTAGNHDYSLAPVMPCHCAAASKRYGIAIRYASMVPIETMFFCPTCMGISIKPFNDFQFIREGIDDEHKFNNPKNEPVLG